jgi:CRP-like cAMP-binding protein
VIKEELKKGDVILQPNSLKKRHGFVVDGCLRSFYKAENGKEHTVQFAIKNWWISDYATLYTDDKSILTIECLMDSTVFFLDKKAVENLYMEYPRFESFQRKNFEKHIATLQKRVLGLLTLTASEKYSQFIEDYASFEKIIPNYQIASYLGITAESLSRIRKERIKK